jgi:hypothetical protein
MSEKPIDPGAKHDAREGVHEGWHNRDYSASEEATSKGRAWPRWTFVLVSLFMLFGLLWGGVIQPLLK